jgi:phenylacetate-CoA ligase
MFDFPRSAVEGMAWPAIPNNDAARMLALQFQFGQSQWWSPEQLREHQLWQFQQIFRHAVTTVPYYRQHFARLAASGISNWEQYCTLPVSTRRDIQQAGSDMHSVAVPPAHGELVSTQSSGSTGSPLNTLGTAWTQLLWRALLLREHLWHKRDLHGKLVAIRTMTEDAVYDSWGAATAAFQTGPSLVRRMSDDLDEQVRWLARENPYYLLSLATNVQALAARSRELGVRLPQLQQVRTYGEMLRPECRAVVREAWGVEVVDSYSSEELGYIALQCPACEHYHVQSESLIVEVLDASGMPCRPGAVGQLVMSTLHNFAMPLLRYASGDYAEVGDDCACGRGLPVLRRVVGRQRNMLVRPGGGLYWPSFPSRDWCHIASIEQIQIVQKDRDSLEVRFVAHRDLTADESAELIAALNNALGSVYRVTLVRLPEIPRTAGGKYEDFISEAG